MKILHKVEMRGGIRLFTSADISHDGSARISLSDGTINANALAHKKVSYVEGAYVPVDKWRQPNSIENALLLTDLPLTPDRTVGLVQIYEGNMVKTIHSFIDDVYFLQRQGELTIGHPLVDDLLRRIEAVCTFGGDVSYNGIAKDPVGMDTVSLDCELNAYVGLHVDSWDRKPIQHRSESKTRICANIGSEDRYFLFVNQSVGDMLAWLEEGGCRIRGSSPNQIGKLFMSKFPGYPVIKLRVGPGEAYVAPTENILHDGCSTELKSAVGHTAFPWRFQVAGEFGIYGASLSGFPCISCGRTSTNSGLSEVSTYGTD